MLERSRRAVFNEDAELYDRARPAYPADLVADLATIAGIGPGSRVLEIGPGTGQATRALVARGAEVVAVELGPSLALVLRRKLPTVQVVVADFDTWPAPEGAFDAVMAFTSWHWLDPATRGRKVTTALRPAGTLATVTTSHVSGGTESFFADAQRCYEQWDPETSEALQLPEPDDVPVWRDEVDEDPAFLTAERRRYLKDIAYRTGEYVDLLRTYSGHRALNPAAQQGLMVCIAALIDDEYVGQVTKQYLYELRMARRR